MFFFQLLSKLPFFVLYRIADVLYVLVYYVIGYRKKVVFQNLSNSFPEKSDAEIRKITKGFYKNFADVFVDTIKLLSVDKKDLEKWIIVEGGEIVENYYKSGDVILIMSNHLASWELIPHRTAQYGIPCDVVYKQLSNPFFEKLMFTLRSRFGTKPIKMQHIFRDMVKRKGEARIVGIISDQAAESPDTAYWATFLHQETDFFMGTEKMARSFNYPVVYAELIRISRGKYCLRFSELVQRPYTTIPMGDITETYIRALEKSIQANPSDWLWSHRRFKHKRKSLMMNE
jgi:KDO2-lipid IV(A) lauroyltransferase